MTTEEKARIKLSAIAIHDSETPLVGCEWMARCSADDIQGVYNGTITDFPRLKQKYRNGKPKATAGPAS